MPRMVVITKPEGSLLPGMMNLAMTPAMNPMMIVQMMPMRTPLERPGDDRAVTSPYTPGAIAPGNAPRGACGDVFVSDNEEIQMSRGMPSMVALLGLLAVAGYQNR